MFKKGQKKQQAQQKQVQNKQPKRVEQEETDLMVNIEEEIKSNYEDSGDSDEEFEAIDNGFFSGLGGESKVKDQNIAKAIEATKLNYESKMTTLEQKVKRRQRRVKETLDNSDDEGQEENEIEKDSDEEDMGKKQKNKKNINKASNDKVLKMAIENLDNQSEHEDDDMGTQITQNQNKKLKEQKLNKKKKKTWQDLGLIKPLLKAVEEMQYEFPTNIQSLSIPAAFQGKDLLASSLTGSGKTAAFLIPILQKFYRSPFTNYSKALIVTPTRELAFQIYEVFTKLNKYTKLRACLVIGQSAMQKQEAELRGNPELIIATPGRLIDHLQNSRSIDLDNLEVLVFDEADKLLDLGFEAAAQNIVENCNKERQTLLFSATLNSEVNKLIDIALRKPIRIQANPDGATNDKLIQKMLRIQDEDFRESALLAIAAKYYKERTIIFFKTKRQTHRMAIIFGLFGLKVCELHGDLSQNQRIQAFSDFKEGKYQYLMATDLASRGLDIQGVKAVINFELPSEVTRYIHRVGRTARAGNEGVSLTIGLDPELKTLKKMLKENKDKMMEKVSLAVETLQKYKEKIRNVEREVEKVLEEEQAERQLRKAEMELQKAENLIKHKDEIMNKPKKTWFQTNHERNKIREAAKAAALGEK
ncbi:hypothetical protein ABPG72_022805 [Tetrahymena utriculariae]